MLSGPPTLDSPGKEDNDFCHVGTPSSPQEDEFSSILKDVGDFGPWQWFIALVNIIMTVTAGIQNNSYPMIVGSSTAWEYDCIPKSVSNYTLLPETQSCKAPVSGASTSSMSMVECSQLPDHRMVYHHEHYEKTVATEFHLMCGYKSYITPLVHSAFTIGCFCGVLLFGWLSDWLGRKKALCIGIPIMIILNFGLSLSPNIQVGQRNQFGQLSQTEKIESRISSVSSYCFTWLYFLWQSPICLSLSSENDCSMISFLETIQIRNTT